MTSIHLFDIELLRNSFKKNMGLLHDILEKQTYIQTTLEKLKAKYSNMIQNNKKKIFIFCLDSYYFQYKMLIVEMENISKIICMIKNRVYGDFYKLYNVILSESYLNVDLSEFANKIKKYIPYKDIEPFYEYKNNDVIEDNYLSIHVLLRIGNIFITSSPKRHVPSSTQLSSTSYPQ